MASKAAAPKSALKKKKAPTPHKSKGVVKKPVLVDPSSDSDPCPTPDGEEYDADDGAAVFGDEDEESNEIEVPPVKRFRKMTADKSSPPSPRAYHPLTGEPLTGLLYVSLTAPAMPAPPLPPMESSSKLKGKEKAVAPSSPTSPSLPSSNKSPTPSGSKAINTATTIALLDSGHVDNTIYACAFHPQIDLQFHEPPSCQVLEYMKLSMLPSVPDSLTKPPTQVHSGREYVYRCHSDIDPHFICPPLLTLPCYNCTLSGYPKECKFKGKVSEEVCSRCKTGHHGPCSAHWDANQLCCAATLLDPLTLSSDGAIHCGVNCVERINAEIALLRNAMHCLHEDHEKIIGELADGLDAIASHEHGTEIIDAYMHISDFLKSFVVRLGEAARDSDAEGGASETGVI
ncbi:hypothetical protein ARMGADRAFT_1089783 [Armillaria gallica]|uniref:Uncharacterized protein n=1 Tax=Armillaria gallica TaxID=47427 RepID=A0A2H3D1Z3_ARMGA|nr:hypothetical protein ARMGADRAFT_1089783 [Armillaria gallica]